MAEDRRKIGFLHQIRRDAVALISLILAITSLGYNTWRNETKVWQTHNDLLLQNADAGEVVNQAINQTRNAILWELKPLD